MSWTWFRPWPPRDAQSTTVLSSQEKKVTEAIANDCTGHIDLTDEDAEKFLGIASSHEFDLLEKKCYQFFLDNVDGHTAFDSWRVADKYFWTDLRERALGVISSCFQQLKSKNGTTDCCTNFWRVEKFKRQTNFYSNDCSNGSSTTKMSSFQWTASH